MRSLFYLSLALATGSSAQVATLFAAYESALASVIASDAGGLTTYLVGCPATQADVTNPANACNLPTPYTQIQGPATVAVAITAPVIGGTFTATCKLQSTTSLSCSEQLIGPNPTNSAALTTQTLITTLTDSASIASLFRTVSLVTNGRSLYGFVPASTTAAPTTTSTSISSSSILSNTTSATSSSFSSTSVALNTTTSYGNGTSSTSPIARTSTTGVVVTASPTAPAATTVATTTRSAAALQTAVGSVWAAGGVAMMVMLGAL